VPPDPLILRTDDAARALVADVESCAYPLERWHHDRHIAVACWYLWHFPRAEATRRMRETIQRFNAHHGIAVTPERGYHETLTLAWLARFHRFLAGADRSRGFARIAADAIAEFSEKRILLEHYTRERILSWEARTGWVEPDLRPLE